MPSAHWGVDANFRNVAVRILARRKVLAAFYCTANPGRIQRPVRLRAFAIRQFLRLVEVLENVADVSIYIVLQWRHRAEVHILGSPCPLEEPLIAV